MLHLRNALLQIARHQLGSVRHWPGFDRPAWCEGPVREGALRLRLLRATRGRLPSKCPCRPEVSRCRASEWVNLLAGERRSVGQSLANILGFQIRIFPNDLVRRHSIGDEIDHQRNGNPHPSDASAPSHNVGVEGDSGEHGDHLSLALSLSSFRRASGGPAQTWRSAPRGSLTV